MKIMKITRLAGAFIVAAGLNSLMLASSHAQDIKLGFNGDISASPTAQAGQSGVLGLQAAIEDVNAKGGVLGRKLALVIRDDLSQPPKSIQNMSELIDNEKVVAIFGPSNSGNAMAWKHLPNAKKVPVIVPIATGTDITKAAGADNYMFRVSMVDRDNIVGLMAYVKNNPASKIIGYMAETTGYGQGGLKDIQEIGDLHGIKPVAIEKFGVADTDMTSQLNKMKAAGVDTIVVWSQSTPTGQLFRSMEKLNYFPLTLTSWVADQDGFFNAAGKSLAERPIFIRTIPGNLTPRLQKFYDRIAPKMSSPTAPLAQAAHAYDSVMLLVAAINQAKSTDGAKVHDALENLQTPYEGIMKTYDKPFSKTQHEGLTAKDFHWVKWQNGKIVSYADSTIKSLKESDFKR